MDFEGNTEGLVNIWVKGGKRKRKTAEGSISCGVREAAWKTRQRKHGKGKEMGLEDVRKKRFRV